MRKLTDEYRNRQNIKKNTLQSMYTYSVIDIIAHPAKIHCFITIWYLCLFLCLCFKTAQN